MVFFRLLESPKYLVHAGRPQEARETLQKILRYNGGANITLRIQDVEDHGQVDAANSSGDVESSGQRLQQRSEDGLVRSNNALGDDEDDDEPIDTPGREASSQPLLSGSNDDDISASKSDEEYSVVERHASAVSRHTFSTSDSTAADLPASLAWLSQSWHPSAADLASRYAELFAAEWKRTTILIWIIWVVCRMVSLHSTFFYRNCWNSDMILPPLLRQQQLLQEASRMTPQSEARCWTFWSTPSLPFQAV